MHKVTPTIKGIFVMSHVRAFERHRGKEAREKLEELCGKPLRYSATEDVPIRDEVDILEKIIDLTVEKPLTPDERAIEAGKLHFKNFSHTPLGSMILPFFRGDFKHLLMSVGSIGESVFRGIELRSEDAGPTAVRIHMMNADYPLGHFQGFFSAWLEYGRLEGIVDAEERDGAYVYAISWNL